MHNLTSSDEYQQLVAEIATEYSQAIERGHTREVARGAVGSYQYVDDELVAVHGAELWGAPIHALDGEALNPYDVIEYSTETVAYSPDEIHGDDTAALAALLLARDLRRHW